ncbi:MAG: phosphoglycolate phosphatase [Gammaproteobacteria bacterium]|nr:phosphoglycolate phosphatase [Gammaproteobacteria bacterium]
MLNADINPELVLIDVDGTLVDSVPDVAFCADTMLARLGQPARGEKNIRQWMGNGVERLVKRALLGQMDGEPEESLFRQAFPIYLDLYAEHTSRHSVLYPGVREGLDLLKARGCRLGCVTNKLARFTEPLLRDLGIYADFDIIVSGDTLGVKKPDPLPLVHAAKALDAALSRTLMLGDSVNDIKAARAAGLQVICVSYGYNHGEDIRNAGPDAVIDSFPELFSTDPWLAVNELKNDS